MSFVWKRNKESCLINEGIGSTLSEEKRSWKGQFWQIASLNLFKGKYNFFSLESFP